MTDEHYFVLTSSCDGVGMEKLTQGELVRRLNHEGYYRRDDQSEWLHDFLNLDLQQSNIKVIIKGRVVVPAPKVKVVTFEVE